MLLYLVYDKVQRTVSTPLLAPTLEIAQTALKQLNPENLNNLIIHPLSDLKNVLDLFLLNLDENKTLPEFLITKSDDSSPIVDSTSESALASQL